MKEFTSKVEIRVTPAMRSQIDNLSQYLQRRPSSWIRDLLQEELQRWAEVPEALYGELGVDPALDSRKTPGKGPEGSGV